MKLLEPRRDEGHWLVWKGQVTYLVSERNTLVASLQAKKNGEFNPFSNFPSIILSLFNISPIKSIIVLGKNEFLSSCMGFKNTTERI